MQTVWTIFFIILSIYPIIPARSETLPVLSWNNLATVIKERFPEEATEGRDRKIAERRQSRDLLFRFDPILQSQIVRQIPSPGVTKESYSLRQLLPFGTELSAALDRSLMMDSQSQNQEARSEKETKTLRIKQQLLKFGPWHGLSADETTKLRYAVNSTKAEISYQDALGEAFKAFANAQLTRQIVKAREKAQDRAFAQLKMVEDLVSSGYRAKADLLIAKANLLRSQINAQDAKQRALDAYRRLHTNLYLSPEQSTLNLSDEKPEKHWVDQLTQLAWPEKSRQDLLADLEAQAAQKAAELASRDDFPELSIGFSLSQTTDLQDQRSDPIVRALELQFSAPITGQIRRDNAGLAHLEAQRALAAKLNTQRRMEGMKLELQGAMQLSDQRLKIAEELEGLAEQSLKVEKERYSDGRATIIDVSRIQDDLDRAQLEHITAFYQMLLSRINWVQAMGFISENLP